MVIAAAYQMASRVATTVMLAGTACVTPVVQMDSKQTSSTVARGVHGSSSSVTETFTWGSTSSGVASLGNGSPVGRRVDLVTHDHDGALGPCDRATCISFNTIDCTFRARDDNSDKQGGYAVPTTHDTVDTTGGASANNMDLGGG
ncbi:hypothetical protein GUJ93_ZPchr0003g17829 [Zizania palustris]|uniref:Uncharacterized protein n=1 Tax=Zizania palustris TaxID=103762 RepID=A0A8J5S617_ZIZPA|nr:hypothetical protein GUJ93_ZPchr0003g17829 [Zizania palustris]